MNEIIRNKIATPTNTLNVLLSLLKCINIVSTKYDFTEAITKAVAIVKPPKFKPATATVIPVNAIRGHPNQNVNSVAVIMLSVF